MLQLTTMRDLLEHLGFTHPFEQYRYERSGVERINVRMLTLTGNGLAFDPPHRDMTLAEQPCVLLISISNELTAGNLTPAHELFHLYQYGYTLFKNSWYLEGVARWSEGLLGKRNYPIGNIPTSREHEEELFSQSYRAISFWMALLNTASPSIQGERNYPDELLVRRYTNGEPVIHHEATTHGATFLIDLLESLDSLDRQISAETGRTQKSWTNSQRTSPDNDAPMLNAIHLLNR